MSNEEEQKNPTPTPAPAATPAPEPVHEVTAPPASLLDRMAPVLDHAPEARDFLEQNGRSLLVGIGAAALLYVGLSAWNNYKESSTRTAETMLFTSQSAESIQEVVDKFGRTPMAPLAQLTLASAKYDAGEFEVAEKLFAEFAAKYPSHTLRDQAAFNRGVCQEASGRLEDALATFLAFGKDKQTHLYPESVFGRARCLEQLGRFPEAKAVYEDFIAANPTNAWGDRASAAMLYVDKAQRESLLPKAAKPAMPLMSLGTPGTGPGLLPTPAQAPAPAPVPAPIPPTAPATPPAAKP